MYQWRTCSWARMELKNGNGEIRDGGSLKIKSIKSYNETSRRTGKIVQMGQWNG